MKALLGVSNRHVHLTKEDYEVLFKDTEVKNIRDLVQPGEYATDKTVTIKTNKNIINNVRVLCPFRSYTQVEISRTDAYFLGINPPIRNSGDLVNSEEITIEGPNGSVTKRCCIIANRHLHINPEDREKYDLKDVEKVIAIANSDKRTIFNDVYLKESENYKLELHLDTDDANGAFLKTGDTLEIIKK